MSYRDHDYGPNPSDKRNAGGRSCAGNIALGFAIPALLAVLVRKARKR